MLQLILGEAGTGKTTETLRRIRASAARRLQPASRSAATSRRLLTPPEPMTSIPVCAISARVAGTLGPCIMPSRLTSV